MTNVHVFPNQGCLVLDDIIAAYTTKSGNVCVHTEDKQLMLRNIGDLHTTLVNFWTAEQLRDDLRLAAPPFQRQLHVYYEEKDLAVKLSSVFCISIQSSVPIFTLHNAETVNIADLNAATAALVGYHKDNARLRELQMAHNVAMRDKTQFVAPFAHSL